MTTTKLALGVTIGTLAAVLVLFGIVQLSQPQDCSLQRLEVSNGERLENDLSDGCR